MEDILIITTTIINIRGTTQIMEDILITADTLIMAEALIMEDTLIMAEFLTMEDTLTMEAILTMGDTLTMVEIPTRPDILTMVDILTIMASTIIAIITALSIREITQTITTTMGTLVTMATPGLFSHKFQDLALRESMKTKTHP